MAFAVMTTVSPLIVTLSTAKPAGISDEGWRLRASDPVLESDERRQHKSSNLSQSPRSPLLSAFARQRFPSFADARPADRE
jgi:hypothetical protein